MSPKGIAPISHPYSYYACIVPRSPLPKHLSIEGRPRQLEGPKFHVPKELNLLPPKDNETLTGLKTNKFADVTCMKYKLSTHVTFDGVRAMPDQIRVVPPRKGSQSSSAESSEPKRPRTSATLEKKIKDLTKIVIRM